eukprot:COSAG02_NODE_44284_length_367_cov_1.354478_1_plen_80_part_01
MRGAVGIVDGVLPPSVRGSRPLHEAGECGHSLSHQLWSLHCVNRSHFSLLLNAKFGSSARALSKEGQRSGRGVFAQAWRR